MPEPYYCTATDVRTELSVDSTVLTDAQALILIQDAEDAIDELLGNYLPDDTTGRKIVEADVEAWQFAKLKRATVKLAAALYQKPDLLTRARWSREKGPDFEVEGPRTNVATPDVLLPLNQSQLRLLTGRARPMQGTSKYDSFFTSTR